MNSAEHGPAAPSAANSVPEIQDLLKEICRLYPHQPRYLVAALEDVQASFGFIPDAVVPMLAEFFGISRASVQQWLDMPGLFRVHPLEQNLLKVCCGPICAERGGKQLLASLKVLPERVDVSLLATHCLGRCNESPVAKLNDHYFTHADEMLLRDHLLAIYENKTGKGL